MWRALLLATSGLALLVAVCAAPVVTVELACTAPSAPASVSIMDASERRAEGDSFLTYPEWYIVHAYADLAGVMRASSESSFDYPQAVTGFWTSLCGATRAASGIGPVTLDQRITNYVIGLSFTAEMAIKGVWERTLGALAVLVRGPQRAPEDDYALQVADDYAAFLQQTPWYMFAFGEKLAGLWRVPWAGAHPVRSVERRVALSLEWGGKALYAKVLAALAGTSPTDLTMRSLVRGPVAASSSAPQVRIVRTLSDGSIIIETPRYSAFTDILRVFARRGVDIVEIAGNRHILTTVLARDGTVLDAGGGRAIFSLPIQSRPGWRRLGFETDVADLPRQIAGAERAGATFEHAYDY